MNPTNVQFSLQDGICVLNEMSMIRFESESRQSLELWIQHEIESTQKALRRIEEMRGQLIDSRLKIIDSVSTHHNDADEICAICQAEYEQNERIAELKCEHKYHAECIKKWLIVKNFCPLCKTVGIAD